MNELFVILCKIEGSLFTSPGIYYLHHNHFDAISKDSKFYVACVEELRILRLKLQGVGPRQPERQNLQVVTALISLCGTRKWNYP
jgi:hypothetical protein